ncbi:DUF2325 domain-containing protein, partial [Streptomyces brasiliscabiei]
RFLHHDGGVEDSMGLLGSLVSRATVALFAVDCVSHDAALQVKRLCRQGSKPYVPMRSLSLAATVGALEQLVAVAGR